MADRGPLRPGQGQRRYLGDDHRAPPRGGPGALRGRGRGPRAAGRRGARATRRGRRRRGGQPRRRARAALPGRAHRVPARVDHPRLLRRVQLPAGRRTARHRAEHHQDPDQGRAHPDARLSGGELSMALLRRSQHTLTGVYALDALDTDAEVARFERHLASCQGCTSEVRGFREAATRLGMAASRQPPPTLRAAEERARHRRLTPRFPWLPRLATAGAAVCLAAAITLGVVLVNTQNQLGNTQQQLSQARNQLAQTKTELAAINAVRTAADATLVTKVTPIGGTVTVVSSASRHQIVVTTRGLPALRAGKVYQLWLIGSQGNKIRSEGLLFLHNGRTGPVLIGGVLRGDIFGITLEPPGGTVQPTVTPFIAIPA